MISTPLHSIRVVAGRVGVPLPFVWRSGTFRWHATATCSETMKEVRKTQLNNIDVRPVSKMPLLWQLSKGKLSVWVAISAMPGYFLAAPFLDAGAMSAVACGTFLTSAAAQTMNQVAEKDRDVLMHRTRNRPLPSGKLSSTEAKAFAAVSGASGFAILTLGCQPLAAAIAGTTMATYLAAYTPLKTMTPYNTHVGAISGSLPTLIGFAGALGTGLWSSPWAMHAAWLFTMQTLWQMPHFYALAWLHKADYIRGGYDMFPLTDETGKATASMSHPYLVVLCALPCGAAAAGLTTWMFPIGTLVPNMAWYYSLHQFGKTPTKSTCRRFFLFSLTYLLAILALFTLYANGVPPAGATKEEEEEADKSSVDLVQKALIEPPWRVSVKKMFCELCPHERMKFSFAKELCPK